MAALVTAALVTVSAPGQWQRIDDTVLDIRVRQTERAIGQLAAIDTGSVDGPVTAQHLAAVADDTTTLQLQAYQPDPTSERTVPALRVAGRTSDCAVLMLADGDVVRVAGRFEQGQAGRCEPTG